MDDAAERMWCHWGDWLAARVTSVESGLAYQVQFDRDGSKRSVPACEISVQAELSLSDLPMHHEVLFPRGATAYRRGTLIGRLGDVRLLVRADDGSGVEHTVPCADVRLPLTSALSGSPLTVGQQVFVLRGSWVACTLLDPAEAAASTSAGQALNALGRCIRLKGVATSTAIEVW